MAQSGFYGERLGAFLRLRDTPSSLIARSIRGAEVAATEARDDNPVHGISGEYPLEDAYLVSLKLRDYPDCEYWERGKCTTKVNVRAGATYLYDFKHAPRYVIDKPFHSLHFYVPAAAINGIAEQYGARRVGQIDCQFGTGFRDEVVHHIGASLLQAVRRPAEANQLFVDHMMLALTAHVAKAYGELRNAEVLSGGLAPWQVKRACEKLEADLAGKLTLQDIAAEVGISASHFSRAFRASVGLPPHQWLLRQRIAAAKQLMTVRSLSLAEIAIAAGFANQSHFTRVFSTLVGVSPRVWRREVRDAAGQE
jgi:AraC-like DNA-binding protein